MTERERVPLPDDVAEDLRLAIARLAADGESPELRPALDRLCGWARMQNLPPEAVVLEAKRIWNEVTPLPPRGHFALHGGRRLTLTRLCSEVYFSGSEPPDELTPP